MRSIYGKQIGTRVPFAGETYQPHHPWPKETPVSAGHGVVFVQDGETYRTLFMEVYPPGASFIRGEGSTREECEDSCWAQYQRALHCVDDKEHEWTPHAVRKDGTLGRRYVNGAGFCLHCRTFRSEVFSGDDLGQFCSVCGIGTTWQHEEGEWYCEEHAIPHPEPSMEDIFHMLEGKTND